MNVIFGEEAFDLVENKYTTLEMDTVFYCEGAQPCPTFAVIGPGDIPFDNFLKLKQFIPLHESLIKNYKEQNWEFCLRVIAELHGNISPFMDEFYVVLGKRISQEIQFPTENWTHVLDLS